MNVRTLCLGVLTFQEASGYEIKKMVEEDVFNHFIDASYGSIYPALTKMLEEGLVTVRAEEQTGKPDKKVYAITAQGRAELARALAVDPVNDKFKSEFLFQILLKEYLPATHISDIYQAQMDYLMQELDHLENCNNEGPPHAGMDFVAGYGRACLSAGMKYLQENRERILSENSTGLKLVAGESDQK